MSKKVLKNTKTLNNVKDVKNTKTKKEKIVDVIKNQSIETINNETADLENQNAEPENNIDVNDIELNDNINEIDNFVENDLIENQTAESINSIKEEPIIIKKEKAEKKTNLIFDILSSETGATLNELIEKTGWQKHSIRGTLSNLQKELQFSLLKVELSRPNPLNNKDFIKETRYFIKDADFMLNDFLIKKQNETADLNLIDNKKVVNE